jgi:hypothetical protein
MADETADREPGAPRAIDWSGWSGTVRRQQRVSGWLTAALIVFMVVMLVGQHVLLSSLAPEGARFDRVLLYGEGVVGGLLAIAVVAIVLARRNSRRRTEEMLERVPRANGLVCPRCRSILATRAGLARCAGCRLELEAADLQDFWQGMTSFKPRQDTAGMAAVEATWRKGPWRERLLWQFKNRMGVSLASNVILLVALATAMTVTIGNRFLVNLVWLLPIILFFVGLTLLRCGISRRIGTSRHCAACDYERDPSRSGNTCPECGASWTKPNAIVRGRRVRSPALMLIGGLLVALSASGCITSGFSFSLPYRSLMPDGMLVWFIGGGPTMASREWAVLQGRRLSPGHQQRLVEGLLATRERGERLGAEAHTWVLAEEAAGRLTADQRDRYYRGMTRIEELLAPGARSGQPVTPELVINLDGPLWTGAGAFMVVREASIGTETVTLDGAAALVHIMALPDATYPRKRWRLPLSIVPPETGTVRMVLRGERVFGPWAIKDAPVTWSPDGTPQLPPQVTWSEPFEYEQELRIGR